MTQIPWAAKFRGSRSRSWKRGGMGSRPPRMSGTQWEQWLGRIRGRRDRSGRRRDIHWVPHLCWFWSIIQLYLWRSPVYLAFAPLFPHPPARGFWYVQTAKEFWRWRLSSLLALLGQLLGGIWSSICSARYPCRLLRISYRYQVQPKKSALWGGDIHPQLFGFIALLQRSLSGQLNTW